MAADRLFDGSDGLFCGPPCNGCGVDLSLCGLDGVFRGRSTGYCVCMGVVVMS